MVLRINHTYIFDKAQSIWFTEALMVLYGPYLCVNSFEIKNASFKVKLKKITIEKLSNFKWGENIELNTMAQLETLNGTVTLKIPYESMQIRLLPFITFKSETHSRSNIDSFLLRLDANQNYEFKKRLTETQLKIFASDFCKHQNIKQGFWDESCKSYFLLFGQNNFTYELNPYGLFLLGSICLDLEIGFFGFCETSLHKKWNHLFFEPWIKQKDPSKLIFPRLFF